MLQYLYIGLGILFIWLIALSVILFNTINHYRRLTGDVAKKDLLSALNHLIATGEQNSEELKKLDQKLNQEIEHSKSHFQKIGFKRYNPFTDTGGDQSFTLCLLDENSHGIVISSLHSRENTRLYAKSIVAGKASNQVLSKDEQDVIKQALK